MNKLLLSALMVLGLATAAQAGEVIIYNKDCTTLDWFQTKQWVNVQIYVPASSGDDCTDATIKVDKGQYSDPVTLAPHYAAANPNSRICEYFYAAENSSPAGPTPDMEGNKFYRMVCEVSILGLCACVLAD